MIGRVLRGGVAASTDAEAFVVIRPSGSRQVTRGCPTASRTDGPRPALAISAYSRGLQIR